MADDKYKDLKAKEIGMFKTWKSSPTPTNFQNIYESFKPLITEATKKYARGSTIPASAHKAYAAQNFMNALNSFDPKKAQLKSWVYTWVNEKGKRLNYMYGNLGSIPETRITKITTFKNTEQMLRDQHGRVPSTHELADALGWGIKDVGLLQKELRKDLLEDATSETMVFNKTDAQKEFLDYLQYELTPEELNVYELIYGLNSKPALLKPNGEPDLTKIGNRLAISESKVRQIKKKIANRIQEHMKRGRI